MKALNAVTPYDWASYLSKRLDETSNHAPFGGLAAGGWKLVYSNQPNPYEQAREGIHKFTDAMFSVGLKVDKKGTIKDLLWDGPAFKAGLVPNMKNRFRERLHFFHHQGAHAGHRRQYAAKPRQARDRGQRFRSNEHIHHRLLGRATPSTSGTRRGHTGLPRRHRHAHCQALNSGISTGTLFLRGTGFPCFIAGCLYRGEQQPGGARTATKNTAECQTT